MATQELTLREEPQAIANRSTLITDVQRLGGLLAASGYFADAREMAQAAVKVLAGEELGIPPVAAMMGINIIKGKIALGGNLIASRIRAHGFDFVHKQFDALACVLAFLGKKGDFDRGHGMMGTRPILGESSYTMEDAKTAQLAGGENYKKNPRNMLFNRAISNGAKWYTPEVFAGAPVYVPEELGATVDEQGDMVHPEPKPAQGQQEIANAKIAEMKAGKSYADVSTADQRQQQPTPADAMVRPEQQPIEAVETQIKARLAQFAKMKDGIGKADYYRILGVHGFEHANEIRTLNEARMIYREMAEVWGQKNQQEAQ